MVILNKEIYKKASFVNFHQVIDEGLYHQVNAIVATNLILSFIKFRITRLHIKD